MNEQLDVYANCMDEANHIFLGQLPPETLELMGVQAQKVNSRMRRHTIEKKRAAMIAYRESIQQEIFDKKPVWEKAAIKKELDALARGEEIPDEDLPSARLERPELTTEYLLSIGRPDLVNLL